MDVPGLGRPAREADLVLAAVDPDPQGRRRPATEAARGPHTFASRLIEQGESLAYVRDQLGHHSIKITVDIYGHLTPGANRAAVDKLDAQEAAVEVRTG